MIGRGPGLILLDTGEGEAEYTPLLESTLKGWPKGPAYIRDIIISHWHHDHVNGLPEVLKLSKNPRIWKFPSDDHSDTVKSILSSVPPNSFEKSKSGDVHELSDGQVLPIDDTSEEILQVVHCPGHTDDSIALILKGKENDEKVSQSLFTADTVLGQGTAVFSDLGTYLSSLRKLVDSVKSDSKVRVYPGHGPTIEDGTAKIEEYYSHRIEREDQVLEGLLAFNSGTQLLEFVQYMILTT